ncbi:MULTISPECIES: GntP family permease [Pasteurellaceae]|uniref:GntP family permease n=1 Tax=Pasteurellaceae TaxID=712 RepID=UPI0035675434
MSITIAFIIGVIILLYLALKVKVSAFMALLATALTIGILSGMGTSATINDIVTGFSKSVGSIGLVIIFGTMLGNYLEQSRAAHKMALDAVRLVGTKNSSIAMSISGYLISIPVFSDVGFLILSPLIKAISQKSKIPLGVLAVALSAGLLATHVYVPPTPGPLAAAGLLGIDIGRAILWGAFAAVLMTFFGWAYAYFYLMKKSDAYYGFVENLNKEEISVDEKELPGSFASVLPLLLPIVLILLNTTCAAIFPKDSLVLSVTKFIGDSNIALVIGALTAIALLGKRIGQEKVLKLMDISLKDAGSIIFITAAGGALGQVLKTSGAGDSLAQAVVSSGLPFILIPFVISAILKIVQGSGVVAVITAATLTAPIANQLNIDPILIFLASGAGARAYCHVNDSYFWVYTNCCGFDMKTGLKTLSNASIFMSLGGLLATLIASLII